MAKIAKYDGKVGSFGKYGGTQVKNINSNRGWYIKVCSICTSTALYYVKDKGYCKEHREDAIAHLRLIGNRGNYILPSVAELLPELESELDLTILKQKAPKVSKSGNIASIPDLDFPDEG